MSIPASLQHKIDLFKAVGRVSFDNGELFVRSNWVAVMIGQNIIPETYDPILADISTADIGNSMTSMSTAMEKAVGKMPNHAEFIKYFTNKSTTNG
jgi:tryptophan halogenase